MRKDSTRDTSDILDKSQPYLQQKAELEAEERRKFELEAQEKRYELDADDTIHEAEGENHRHEFSTERIRSPMLSIRTRQESRGEEYSRELGSP